MAVATIKLHQTGKSLLAELKPKEVGVIEFRPHDNYDGEFGFDWVLYNDDTIYKDIIGKYKIKRKGNIFDSDNNEYEKFLGKYKNFRHPIDKKKKYYIPYMTLLPERTAKLILRIKITEEIQNYKFSYDENIFTLDKSETDLNKSIGEHKNIELNIKCLKSFSKNEYISVYGDGKLMGAIIVIANKNILQKDIICYKVVTLPHLKKWEEDTDEKEKIESHIKKYLAQFYIEPIINFKDYIDYERDEKLVNFIRENHLLMERNSRVINTEKIEFNNIYSFFESNINNNEDNSYKIFFIPFAGGKIVDGKIELASGYSEKIGGKISVIFSSHYDKKVAPTHELLHCFGLPHTFEEGLDVVFEENKTNNLMDYTKTERSSSLFMQWRKVNKNINNNIDEIKLENE